MGIYRQSIWKANHISLIFIVSLMLPFYLRMIITNIELAVSNPILFVLCGGMFLLEFLIPTTFFYVVITSKEIQLKNPVYRFWHSEFRFFEIEKIVLGYEGGRTPHYMQIFYSGRKSWRYVIDLVNRKQYKDLIAELEAKGVKVELKNVKLR